MPRLKQRSCRPSIGKVYYYKRNYTELIGALTKCHENGGGDYLTYFMLGKGYQKSSKSTEAIAAFKKSIELKSNNYNSQFAMGQIYLSQQKYKSAASAFKSAMKINSKKYLAAYNYAIAVETNNPDDISTRRQE
jgi:tetratricopeptide (TPR) repeat protein